MRRYVLSARARSDLHRIWNYIAEDNVDAADKVRDKIHEGIQKIARMPNIGHTRSDVANPRYRFWLVGSYLIAYFPDADPLQVVRIVHAARDFKKLFKN